MCVLQHGDWGEEKEVVGVRVVVGEKVEVEENVMVEMKEGKVGVYVGDKEMVVMGGEKVEGGEGGKRWWWRVEVWKVGFGVVWEGGVWVGEKWVGQEWVGEVWVWDGYIVDRSKCLCSLLCFQVLCMSNGSSSRRNCRELNPLSVYSR